MKIWRGQKDGSRARHNPRRMLPAALRLLVIAALSMCAIVLIVCREAPLFMHADNGNEAVPFHPSTAETDAEAVGALVAPVLSMPRMCNTRNMRPLAPRPPTFNPDSFVIAVGIPSLDNDVRGPLRQAQRDSWLHYRDVAAPSNGFRGRMMVEYFFGAAFENNYTFSASLLREASEHANVLVMDVKEPPRVPKRLLTSGKIGEAADVTVGLKVLAYYCYAEETYRRAKFIVKADDDEFIRVPVVMRTVEMLPSYGVMWARRLQERWNRRVAKTLICSTWGTWIGMTRDVLHVVNSYRHLQQYGTLEVVEGGLRWSNGAVVTFEWLYRNTPFYSEDVIPGAVLAYFTQKSGLPRSLGMRYDMHLYTEPECRIHNPINDRGWDGFWHATNPLTMVAHHTNRSEHLRLMELFPEDDVYDAAFVPGERDICTGGPMMVTRVCEDPRAKLVK